MIQGSHCLATLLNEDSCTSLGLKSTECLSPTFILLKHWLKTYPCRRRRQASAPSYTSRLVKVPNTLQEVLKLPSHSFRGRQEGNQGGRAREMFPTPIINYTEA